MQTTGLLSASSSQANYQSTFSIDDDNVEFLLKKSPPLAAVLDQVVIRQIEPGSQLCRTVIVRISSISLAVLGFGMGTTFMFLPTFSLKSRALKLTSQVGSIVGGIFPAVHWVRIGEGWIQSRSAEENAIRYRYRSAPLRVLKVMADYGLGVFTQFPLCEVFFSFIANKTLASLGAGLVVIGNASPTISSTEDLTESLDGIRRYVQRRFCCSSPEMKEGVRVTQLFKKRLKQNLRLGLAMTKEQRVRRFKALYLSEAQKQMGPQLQELRALCRLLMEEISEPNELSPPAPTWQRGMSLLFQLIFGLISAYAFDLIQTGGMTRDSAHLLTDDEAATDLIVAGAVIAWLYVLSKGAGDAVVKTFGQITDIAGVPRQKSFAEQYYPKMSKLVNGVSLLLSWLPLGAIAAIAEPYFDLEEDFGKALYLGAIVSSTAVFQDAMSHLGEEILEWHAGSRKADEETRHALQFKQRVERMGEILSQCSVPDMEKLLKWTEDGELMQNLASSSTGSPEGANFLV